MDQSFDFRDASRTAWESVIVTAEKAFTLSSAMDARVVVLAFQAKVNFVATDKPGALAPLHTYVQLPTGRSTLGAKEGVAGLVRSRDLNPKLTLFPDLRKQ